MQNSRSRFRQRADDRRRASSEQQPGAGDETHADLNGRWTGYHPTLAEAMTRARLQAVRASQEEERRDD